MTLHCSVRDSKSAQSLFWRCLVSGIKLSPLHFTSLHADLCFHQQLHDNRERIVHPGCPQMGGQRFGKTVQPSGHASSLSGLWQQSPLWILASSLPLLQYVPTMQPQCFSKTPNWYCFLSQNSVPSPPPLLSSYYSQVRRQQPRSSLLGETSPPASWPS